MWRAAGCRGSVLSGDWTEGLNDCLGEVSHGGFDLDACQFCRIECR